MGFLNLLTSMILNDLEPSKIVFLVNFSQFLAAAHISRVNCNKMAGEKPRQPAFLALNVDFSSSSPDPLGSKKSAQAGVKKGYSLLKSGYFTTVGSCSVKTVANRHRHAAHHNKH